MRANVGFAANKLYVLIYCTQVYGSQWNWFHSSLSPPDQQDRFQTNRLLSEMDLSDRSGHGPWMHDGDAFPTAGVATCPDSRFETGPLLYVLRNICTAEITPSNAFNGGHMPCTCFWRNWIPKYGSLKHNPFKNSMEKKAVRFPDFLVMAMGCEHRGVLGLKLDPPLVRCLIQPGPDRSHGLCCQRPLTNEAPGSAALQLRGTRFPQPCALGSGRSVGPPWLFFWKGSWAGCRHPLPE